MHIHRTKIVTTMFRLSATSELNKIFFFLGGGGGGGRERCCGKVVCVCVVGGEGGGLVNIHEQMFQMALLLFKESTCAKLL